MVWKPLKLSNYTPNLTPRPHRIVARKHRFLPATRAPTKIYQPFHNTKNHAHLHHLRAKNPAERPNHTGASLSLIQSFPFIRRVIQYRISVEHGKISCDELAPRPTTRSPGRRRENCLMVRMSCSAARACRLSPAGGGRRPRAHEAPLARSRLVVLASGRTFVRGLCVRDGFQGRG